MASRTLVRCTDPFAYTDPKSGQNKVVTVGQLFASTDPVIKGREQWFETVETLGGGVVTVPASVESATAAPGEKRSVSKPDA